MAKILFAVFLSTALEYALGQTFLLEPESGFDGPFCREPDDIPSRDDPYIGTRHCKAKEAKWKAFEERKYLETGSEFSWNQRKVSNECGPHCRPSCVTLMLDLNKLAYQSEVTCTANELCQCSHSRHPSSTCGDDRLESLFENHPKCYLQDADCLGPTLFDNRVKRAIDLQPSIGQLPSLKQCDSIPDTDLYCRFQDWKLLTPIEKERCKDGTFSDCMDDSKIYWEYCNVVEEDPDCDRDEDCDDGKDNRRCGRNCPKLIEPLPPGWTTFVLSAPIPFQPQWNSVCGDRLPLAGETDSACFLQRIEIYYPPEDDDCSIGCPHCHDCPLLSLGDTFGPVEVVRFGHEEKEDNGRERCGSCDARDTFRCDATDEWRCGTLNKHDCRASTNCFTDEVLRLPDFVDNQCSFQDQSSASGPASGSASGSDSSLASGSDTGFNFANSGEFTVTTEAAALKPGARGSLLALLALVVLGIAIICTYFLKKLRARLFSNAKRSVGSMSESGSSMVESEVDSDSDQ